MLTHHDVTIPNALDVFQGIKNTGIQDIGFKDIGIPFNESKKLVTAIKKEGIHVYFEVVSTSKDDTIQSARQAAELGVDYIIGGNYFEEVFAIAREGNIHYYPYVGEIFGRPCSLGGTIDEIFKQAREYQNRGVDGLNLLAYRYNGNPDRLIGSVKAAVALPLIIAGSVDSPEKIKFLTSLNISAFTVGTALFEKQFLPGKSLRDQVTFVVNEARH